VDRSGDQALVCGRQGCQHQARLVELAQSTRQQQLRGGLNAAAVDEPWIHGGGAAPAAAQDAASSYPSRPVRIVVGFAAGAIIDITARSITPGLSQRLGQPVVVDNKPGAGGLIAAEHVARAAPDGYTLMIAPTSTMAVNPAVYSKLSYDPRRDFEPVSLLGNMVLYLTVNSGLEHEGRPVTTLAELVTHAKANPDKANFGAMAPGFEMMTSVLSTRSGAKFVTIPFKSTAETMASLLNGQIMIAYQDYNSLTAQLKAGKVRPLVTTGSVRSPDLPDVPTFGESGHPDLFLDSINGIIVPKKTPAEIIAKLEAALMATMKQPDVIERWRAMGQVPIGSTTKEYAAIVVAEAERWKALAKATNTQLD
jgi:tripartite-type tricarboxylate transporter receptor subunit TctC